MIKVSYIFYNAPMVVVNDLRNRRVWCFNFSYSNLLTKPIFCGNQHRTRDIALESTNPYLRTYARYRSAVAGG